MYSHLGGNILNDQNEDINKEVKNGSNYITKFVDCNSYLAVMKL